MKHWLSAIRRNKEPGKVSRVFLLTKYYKNGGSDSMDDQQVVIKEIVAQNEIENSARIIRDSFQTVAVQFGLTRKNCPAHPSFITENQLFTMKSKGPIFFGLFVDGTQTGFVAVEKGDGDGDVFYLEKLAVLPDQRHRGYGRRLLEQACDFIRAEGGKKVSIGIIDEHMILKNWYRGLGFREVGTQQFPHLPFTVCFMAKET
jgi:diamine N-acetyltransferase